jgi:hypothetical protein
MEHLDKKIDISGPLLPSESNCPTRVGEIVENLSDIYNIPSPRLGMQVFVKSEKKSFVITSLKSKVIGGVDVPEAAVEAFEPAGAKSITWNNDNDPSDMDDFVVAGVYDIKGEHKREDDNLPVLNTGGGHSFNARLTVLDSSISGSGKNDDKCITQVLSFSNRLGQGEVYIRTGKGSSLNNLTWEKWSTLQRNVDVGELNSKVDLNNYIDNGIYSGVFRYSSGLYNLRTFVMIVINDYAIGLSPRMVSQFLYSVDKETGKVTYETRTCEGETWNKWEILNKGEIDSMISVAVDNAIEALFAAIKANADKIEETIDYAGEEFTKLRTADNIIKAAALRYDGLTTQTTPTKVAIKTTSVDTAKNFTFDILAATTEKAGVMSAEDKKYLNDVYDVYNAPTTVVFDDSSETAVLGNSHIYRDDVLRVYHAVVDIEDECLILN